MTYDLKTLTRDQIADFLPEALDRALESYRTFSEGVPDTDDGDSKASPSRQFKDHHDAAKAAIAHVELLIKLAKWAELPDEDDPSSPHDRLMQALTDAQMEIDGAG